MELFVCFLLISFKGILSPKRVGDKDPFVLFQGCDGVMAGRSSNPSLTGWGFLPNLFITVPLK